MTSSGPLIANSPWLLQFLAELPRHFLDELPGDAARARAARYRPLDRLLAQALDRHAQLIIGGVAFDHGEERVLVGIVEAQPQAEAVAERYLLLDRLRRIYSRRALVLDHVARHQVATVGRGIEDHVVRPALDAALEHGLQRLVGRVLTVEGEVVAEYQEAALRLADHAEQRRQRGDVLAVDLDQRQRSRRPAHLAVHVGVDGLHDRALAGAARAPQQRVVGRQPLGETPRVLEQGLLLAVDAHQQVELDPVDLGDGFHAVAGRMPDIGFGRCDVGTCGGGRGEPVERFYDA